jgi:hypothetical protein
MNPIRRGTIRVLRNHPTKRLHTSSATTGSCQQPEFSGTYSH